MQPVDWNVLATAQAGALPRLTPLLRRHGRFQRSPFRGLILGTVPDTDDFLEDLSAAFQRDPEVPRVVARVIPIDEVFGVVPETLEERLKVAVEPYAKRIGGGTFHVRVERRGHKGELHTQPLEHALDEHLLGILRAQGFEPRLAFDDPDWIVVVELVGGQCGVGAVSREQRRRYPFVRVR
jgi:tRNA(Ser,Leu) C12 N-acetylase TAN1